MGKDEDFWKVMRSSEQTLMKKKQDKRQKTNGGSHIPHHVKLLNLFVIMAQMKMTCEMWWSCTYNNKTIVHKILPNNHSEIKAYEICDTRVITPSIVVFSHHFSFWLWFIFYGATTSFPFMISLKSLRKWKCLKHL